MPVQQTRSPTPEDRPRPCLNCGYDLRGLSPGAPCPECGRRSAEPSPRDADALANAPRREQYLALAIYTAFAAAAILMFLVVGLRCAIAIRGNLTIFATWPDLAIGWTVALAWVAACFAFARVPARGPTKPAEWRPIGLLAAATQAGWLAVVVLLHITWAHGWDPGRTLAGVVAFGSLAGLLPLMLQLADHTEIVDEDDKVSRIRAAAVWLGIALAALAAVVALNLLARVLNLDVLNAFLLFFQIFFAIPIGVAFFACAYAAWASVGLPFAARWSITYARTAAEREIRAREKQKRAEDEGRLHRIAEPIPAPDPDAESEAIFEPTDAPDPDPDAEQYRPHKSASEHIIEPSGTDPYALEDDDPRP